jgi:hypothetical protein
LLAVSLLIGNLEDHVGNVLSMGGKHKALAACWVVVAVTKLTASLLLLPVMGLAAPAAGTLIGVVVGKVLFEFPIALKLIEVSAARYLKYVFVPTLPAAIVGGSTFVVLSANTTTVSLLGLMGHLTAGSLAFGVVYLVVALPTLGLGPWRRSRLAGPEPDAASAGSFPSATTSPIGAAVEGDFDETSVPRSVCVER